MAGLLKKLFGDSNEREIKRLKNTVQQIEALESSMKALSDSELRGKTAEFKNRYANGESLEELLPEAFAVVRRLPYAPWGCVISMYNCWVELYFIKAVLLK